MMASVGRAPMIICDGARTLVTPAVQVRQAYFGRTVTMTRDCDGTMSSRSLRSSPILCMTPPPQGQLRLSGSMTSSMRGSAAGRLPMVRFGADLVVVLAPVLAASWSFYTSTSAKAIDRFSNASCRSSSVSFSDRLPCRAGFSYAIRCSCHRVIFVSAATFSINAKTAVLCAAWMVDWSIADVVIMPSGYNRNPIKNTQKTTVDLLCFLHRWGHPYMQ